MFAVEFSWTEQSRLYCIPEKSKMNGELFIKHVLTPIVKEDIPKLYGSEAPEVVIQNGLDVQSHVPDSGRMTII